MSYVTCDTSSIETSIGDIETSLLGVETEVAKIDNASVLGLSGTHDSLAYKVHEIEKHLHAIERWYGKNPTTGFLLAESLTSFQTTAGLLEAWGTELQISQGTEVEGGDSNKKVDFHRVFFTSASSTDSTFFLELRYGETTFASSSLLTQVAYRRGSTTTEVVPVNSVSIRIPCNQKIWARCKSQDGGETLDFILGLHTYNN